MTKKYELVCIFDPQLGDTAFEPLVEKYESQLKAAGAEIVNIDRWGLRKMAYTSVGLKQRQQGFYVLYQFTAAPESMGEGLLHELKMDEGVLRHLLVTVTGEFLRVPQLAPENVYVYSRPDRDFRGGPGGRGRYRSDRDRRPDSRRPDDRRPTEGGASPTASPTASPAASPTASPTPSAPAVVATAEGGEGGADAPVEKAPTVAPDAKPSE